MAQANQFDFLDRAMGAGVPFGYDPIDAMLDRGADFSSSGGEGAYTFNAESGLGSWKTAVGGGGRQHVVILGDSNVTHDPATPNRWAQLIKADLLSISGLASGGEGFRHLGLAEWAVTGTWTHLGASNNALPSTDLGPNGLAYFAIGNSNLWTWTLPGGFGAHDRWDIYGVDDDLFVQPLQYSANGGAFTNTAFDNGPTLGARLVKQTVVTPITTTLAVRPSNAVFQSYLVGAAFYNGTSGLVTHNLGYGGMKAVDIAGTDGTQRLALLDDLQPKLTIIWVGTNDFHHAPPINIKQQSLDDWYKYYDKLVAKAKQYGDCWMIYPMASQIPNALTIGPSPHSQAQYARVARAIADKRDATFTSIHQAWGPWERANARGFQLDAWHLNSAGHTRVHSLLKGILTRNS